MGRTKTQIEKTKEVTTLTKILKLTYLQSLAVYLGGATVKDFAGETEGSQETIKANSSMDRNAINKIHHKLTDNKGVLAGIVLLPPGLAGLIGSTIGNALFGKKKKVETTINVKDSGWTISKTWAQPEFDLIRYAIGIKELVVSHFTYASISEIVSTPWASPKEISKVSLVVDEFIPQEFPVGNPYIEYYVKPEVADIEWIRINPIGSRTVYTSDNKIVPRIVNFNIEKPVSSKLEESFVITKEPVKEIRFKAILKRPETLANGTSAVSHTPLLKSYRLLMFPRGGL